MIEEQRLATILWRGKWLILASFGVGIVLAVVVTKSSQKVYEAQATIQVSSGAAGASGASPSDVVAANQGLASTYATLIVDPSFLQTIRKSVLRGRLGTSELSARLNASAITDTALVKLVAQGPSPDEARALATQLANAFIDYVRRDAGQRSTVLQQQVQAQIRQLNTQIAQGGSADRVDSLRAQRNQLSQELERIVAQQIAQAGSVSVTGQPTGSSAPVSPRPALNLVAGALLGLLVGAGLSFLRARLDRGLHNSHEAEELVHAPILASIPVRRRYSSDDPILGEAHDVLRANLAFLSLDTPMHVLTFSSFNPREGKTSTVEGLAFAAVRGGYAVLMIDGDVRTRTLSSRLGQEDAPGLTNVIVGMATPEESIVEIAPGLSLLPAGPTPPNPPSLLSSNRMRETVEQLRGRYNLVLIDSPPVANLADGSILAAVSDGVVVVARVGVTDRSDLSRAGANLRHSPTPIVGVVVLEPRTVDQTYYPSMSRGAPAVPDSVAS